MVSFSWITEGNIAMDFVQKMKHSDADNHVMGNTFEWVEGRD